MLSDAGDSRTGFSVSVIVPCYNSAATIGRCLRSVLDQAVEDLEVIVVDDGSGDGTREILREYESSIRYVFQQNRGVSSARNVGASLASKEWIAFCDADDIWFPEKLSTCAQVIRQIEECEFVFHDFSVVYDDQVVAERGTHSKHSFFPMLKRHGLTLPQMLSEHRRYVLKLPNVGDVFVDTYRGCGLPWMILGNFVLPSSVVMKRRLFLQLDGFDEEFKVSEDTEFFLRLAKRTDFFYIDRPLHAYWRSSGSLISKHLEETLLYGIRGLEKNCLADHDFMIRYTPYVRASLARRKADLAYFYLSELCTDKAFRCALAALRHDCSSSMAWKVFFLSLLPRRFLRLASEIKRKRGI